METAPHTTELQISSSYPSPFSIENYRLSKLQRAQTTLDIPRRQQMKATKDPSTHRREIERERKEETLAVSCEMLSGAKTAGSDDENKAAGYLGNNYFVSKINKVRRNRTLTAMEAFEMELEKRQLLIKYLEKRKKKSGEPRKTAGRNRRIHFVNEENDMENKDDYLTSAADCFSVSESECCVNQSSCISTQTDSATEQRSLRDIISLRNTNSTRRHATNNSSVIWNSNTADCLPNSTAHLYRSYLAIPPARPPTAVHHIFGRVTNPKLALLAYPKSVTSTIILPRTLAGSQGSDTKSPLEKVLERDIGGKDVRIDKYQIKNLAAKLNLPTKY